MSDDGQIDPRGGAERREQPATGRHPSISGLLRWFEYDHLPPHLQAVSRPVGDLAHRMVDALPDDPELATGLRKLLEAKDCFVRVAVDLGPEMTRSEPETPLERPYPRSPCPNGCDLGQYGTHAPDCSRAVR